MNQRAKSDDDNFFRSFAELSSAVMGREALTDLDASVLAKTAFEAILKHYKLPLFDMPDNITDPPQQIEYALRKSGLARRKVNLKPDWYKDSFGAYLGTLADGVTPVAILQGKAGYYYIDYVRGKNVIITAKTACHISDTAYCFYKPLPARPLSAKDFLCYIISLTRPKDFLLLGAAVLLAMLFGLLTPYATAQLIGNVLHMGDISVLIAAAVFLCGAAVGTYLIGIVRTMVTFSIGAKAKLSVGAAIYMRLLSLPVSFFGGKSSAEVATRANQAELLCDLIINGLVVTGLTVLLSFIYVGQVFVYAPDLTAAAILVIVGNIAFSLVSVLVSKTYTATLLEHSVKEQGLAFSLFGGVQKIKLTGAEKRAFSKWAKLYSAGARLRYRPPIVIRFRVFFNLLINSAGVFVFYLLAVKSDVSTSEYIAFSAAFGLVTAALAQFTGQEGGTIQQSETSASEAGVGAAQAFAMIRAILANMKEILEAEPEISEGKQIAQRLSGAVELTNVFFRYSEHTPLVLDNISLKIKAGSYIAIVGATGCGKSTLMRLMLGFESPTKGAIYYDGKDLSRLDLKSFRKAGVGVVLQNGSLFQGDIFSNITISAPTLTLKDAWEAAEIAGLADDIRAMPMGMHTLISEGDGGVSGGQKQRLMIARAVAAKPKLLLLDEATSALDNITQRQVSDSLAKLKCTRIVIAHRLSTIRACDRIIFLDNGKIAEDGSYDELIAKDGRFADLVKRQQI